MVGPVPPQTLEAILAATPSLTRDLTPETRQNILFILRGVALARLDSIGERQALDAIKTKTGLPIGDLRRQLAGFRREMGLATANKQRWASQLIIGDDGTPRAVTIASRIACSWAEAGIADRSIGSTAAAIEAVGTPQPQAIIATDDPNALLDHILTPSDASLAGDRWRSTHRPAG